MSKTSPQGTLNEIHASMGRVCLKLVQKWEEDLEKGVAPPASLLNGVRAFLVDNQCIRPSTEPLKEQFDAHTEDVSMINEILEEMTNVR